MAEPTCRLDPRLSLSDFRCFLVTVTGSVVLDAGLCALDLSEALWSFESRPESRSKEFSCRHLIRDTLDVEFAAETRHYANDTAGFFRKGVQ